MSRILVLYHSYDDQTRRIAERIGEVLRSEGHDVAASRFDGKAAIPDVKPFDAVIVGAAIRYGHHERAFEKALKPIAPRLARRPNAFFSVCLSAGGPGHKPQAARRYVEAPLPRRVGRRKGDPPVEKDGFQETRTAG